jgi:hypothetical protein
MRYLSFILIPGRLGIVIAFMIYISFFWFLHAREAERCHDRGNSPNYLFLNF